MRVVLAAMLIVNIVGCCAVDTKMWTRDENDYLHPDCEDRLNGVPVMLKVPSHIEIVIKETLYADHAPGRLEVVRLKRPDLKVDAELKYTEKMFLVDPVRVMAGEGQYGFGFVGAKNGPAISNANGDVQHGHGYLHSANYEADDQTIRQSADLLSSVLQFAGPSASRSSASEKLDLIEIERVVAFRRFDLGSPTVDEEVFAFLECHMNHCHNCRDDSRLIWTDSGSAPRQPLAGIQSPLPAPAKLPPGLFE